MDDPSLYDDTAWLDDVFAEEPTKRQTPQPYSQPQRAVYQPQALSRSPNVYQQEGAYSQSPRHPQPGMAGQPYGRQTPLNSQPVAYNYPTTLQRTASAATAASAEVPLSSVQGQLKLLLDKFRHVRKRRKLNLEKVSLILGVDRKELTDFNRGKKANWQYRSRLENWLTTPENVDALRNFSLVPRKPSVQKLPGSSVKLERNRSLMWQQGYSQAYYQPVSQRNSVIAKREVFSPISATQEVSQFPQPPFSHQAPGNQYSSSRSGSWVGQPSQMMNNQRLMPSSHPNVQPPLSPNAIRQLANILKRNSNEILHKGIDTAVDDFYEMFKNFKQRDQEKHRDPRASAVDYSSFTKVLLNRLVTMCGANEVIKAQNELKSRSHISSSFYAGNQGAKLRSRGDEESKKMIFLLKAWNHACTCKEAYCSDSLCAKIKPALDHQRRLKQSGMPCPNIENCLHCDLHRKLSNWSRNCLEPRRPGQVPSVPSYGQPPRSTIDAQKYQSARNFSQHSHLPRPVQRSSSLPSGRPKHDSLEVDDGMAAVADLFDERKHNLNISVNVNIQEGGSTGSQRKSVFLQQAAKRKNNLIEEQNVNVKKPRNSHELGFPPSSGGRPQSSHSNSYDVDDDLADLFKEEPISEPTPANYDSLARPSLGGSTVKRVLCVVCQSNDRDVVLHPCKHCCVCQGCVEKLRQCPMCRANITSTSPIYLS